MIQLGKGYDISLTGEIIVETCGLDKDDIRDKLIINKIIIIPENIQNSLVKIKDKRRKIKTPNMIPKAICKIINLKPAHLISFSNKGTGEKPLYYMPLKPAKQV